MKTRNFLYFPPPLSVFFPTKQNFSLCAKVFFRFWMKYFEQSEQEYNLIEAKLKSHLQYLRTRNLVVIIIFISILILILIFFTSIFWCMMGNKHCNVIINLRLKYSENIIFLVWNNCISRSRSRSRSWCLQSESVCGMRTYMFCPLCSNQ